jgi:RHS repeat-associated protein
LVPGQYDGSVLWIDGDGSTRKYVDTHRTRPADGAAVFLTRDLDRLDSLLYYPASGTYVRILPHRAFTQFNGAGQHVSTVDRLGRVTSFQYSGSVLSGITVPSPSGGVPYTVQSTGGIVTSITAPAVGGQQRVVQLVRKLNGDGSPSIGVERLIDWHGSTSDTVSFTFQPWAPDFSYASRTDRRGTKVTLGAEPQAATLTDAWIDSTGLAIHHHWRTPHGFLALPGADPEPVAEARYVYDGPRTDVGDTTSIWVDRWGTPVTIRNALGQTTTLAHGDARFPALTTSVTAPNGFITTASYDGAGHIWQQVAHNPYGDVPARDAVTTYAYDGLWGEVTKVVGPDGDSTTYGIDPATGQRAWQQDGRGDSTRVNFLYYLNDRLLQYIVLPRSVGYTSLVYDALGNLQVENTPERGFTRTHRDGLGRADSVYTGIDATHSHVQVIEYDLMGRVWRESQYGPAVNTGMALDGTTTITYPATSVTTTNFFGAGGTLDSTTRSPSTGTVTALTTRYRYDALGRVRAVVSPDNTVDSTTYDPAGNDTMHVTRNGDLLHSTFDALNRVVTRAMPAKTLPSHDARICELGYCGSYPDLYPHFDLSAAGHLTFAADTARFEYDPLSGQMTTANNAASQVKRTYFPNGALQTETQHLRTLSTGVIEPNVHDYTLAYRYDLSGRRLGLQVPDVTRPRNSAGVVLGSEIQYSYRPDNGALSAITDLLGHVSSAEYNVRGERWRTSLPGAVVTDTLDLEGRVVRSAARWGNDTQLRANAMTYDAQGKLTSMVGTAGPRVTVRSWYSGLGQLVHSHSESWDGTWSNQNFVTEEYFDITGLGDIRQSVMRTNYGYHTGGGLLYDEGSAQTTTTKTRLYNSANDELQRQFDAQRLDTLEYDLAGNTVFTRGLSIADGSTMEERASFYDASGRLRVSDTRHGEVGQFARTFEESFEDALGRRVLVRTRRACAHPDQVFDRYCELSTVRRTIWDGSAELAEIQQPATAADMENDGAVTTRQETRAGDAYNPNSFFGTVVYTYGLYGADHPVSVMRLHYVDWTTPTAKVAFDTLTISPLWNALGQMDVAVFPNGSRRDSVGGKAVKLEFPTAWFPYYRSRYLAQSWLGTLLEDKGDGSGLLYRRNRYYDPSTGRFTQEDPIGLAGGMNLYGFAGGDPVNFSDPLGLASCPIGATVCPLEEAYNSAVAGIRDVGNAISGQVDKLVGRLSIYAEGNTGVFSAGAEIGGNGTATASFQGELNTQGIGAAGGVRARLMTAPAGSVPFSGSVKLGPGSLVVKGAASSSAAAITSIGYEFGKGIGRNMTVDPTRGASIKIPWLGSGCVSTDKTGCH